MKNNFHFIIAKKFGIDTALAVTKQWLKEQYEHFFGLFNPLFTADFEPVWSISQLKNNQKMANLVPLS